nr:hypothetical protein [Candidatus Rhodoblastus alkanivorans]
MFFLAFPTVAFPAVSWARAPALSPIQTPPRIVAAIAGGSGTPAQDSQQPRVAVTFNAVFAPGDIQAIGSGLKWRVFDARPDADGGHALIAESSDAAPNFQLPDGDYIVHAACGLAGADKRFAVNGAPVDERLVMHAGALKIEGQLGDTTIPASHLNIMVYLPDRDDPEAKLIIPNLKAGEPECLPEGAYHIVSRLMDVAPGSTVPTNSTVNADLRVQAGKLTDGVLRHRAATMTLKLVNAHGGEALANTSFSVLTPGGDVIREMIGAFPSLVLAEGEYVAIARHENKTYQASFRVVANQDRDVDVLTSQPAQ